MPENNKHFSEPGDDTPIIGIGRSGIESVVVRGEIDLSDFDALLNAMIARLQAELELNIIDKATFDALASYLGGLELAGNDGQQRDGNNLVVIDDEREPQAALFSRPLYEGSNHRIYYLVTGKNALGEGYFANVQEHVDKDREWLEMAIATAESLPAPYDIDRIMVPIDENAEPDDVHNTILLIEAVNAHVKGVIDDKQLEAIQSAILYRDIFKLEIVNVEFFVGNDGRKYRIYNFPKSGTSLERDDNA